MESKKLHLIAIATLVLAIALVHTSIHVAMYGSGIDGVYKSGISGFSIGSLDSEHIKTQYPAFSKTSFNIVGLEWMILITLILFTIVAKKVESLTLGLNSNITKIYSGSNTKTELDVLYEVLKTSGSLKISAAAKLFNVSNEKIMEWSKILESANLASIYYPRLSEPEIALKN